jgi:hypothetical protein
VSVWIVESESPGRSGKDAERRQRSLGATVGLEDLSALQLGVHGLVKR